MRQNICQFMYQLHFHWPVQSVTRLQRQQNKVGLFENCSQIWAQSLVWEAPSRGQISGLNEAKWWKSISQIWNLYWLFIQQSGTSCLWSLRVNRFFSVYTLTHITTVLNYSFEGMKYQKMKILTFILLGWIPLWPIYHANVTPELK